MIENGSATISDENDPRAAPWRPQPKNLKAAFKRMNKAVQVDVQNMKGKRAEGSPTKKKKISHKEKDGEKRLRVFRKQPPLSYLEKLSRATSQR